MRNRTNVCGMRRYNEEMPSMLECVALLAESNGVPVSDFVLFSNGWARCLAQVLLCVVQGSSLTFFRLRLPDHSIAVRMKRK
jgi:hypothetical protein